MDHLKIKQKNNTKFKETGDSRYWNKLHKASFQHDMAYRDFKDLPRWTASDKLLRDRKTYYLLKIEIMMDINLELVQRFINVLMKIR